MILNVGQSDIDFHRTCIIHDGLQETYRQFVCSDYGNLGCIFSPRDRFCGAPWDSMNSPSRSASRSTDSVSSTTKLSYALKLGPSRDKETSCLAILRANRAVHNEAIGVLYGDNLIRYYTDLAPGNREITSPIRGSETYLQSLRRLEICCNNPYTAN